MFPLIGCFPKREDSIHSSRGCADVRGGSSVKMHTRAATRTVQDFRVPVAAVKIKFFGGLSFAADS